MKGNLNLQTALSLTFVLVFVPAIAAATQDTQDKANQPQDPQKVEAPQEDAAKSKEKVSIHATVQSGLYEKIKKLLDQGIDVNEKEGNGFTPLFYAIMQGHKEIAELLIEKGVDVNVKNNWDEVPLRSNSAVFASKSFFLHIFTPPAKPL